MRTIREQVYYSNNTVGEGNLKFPQHPKSYFETSCSEWEDTSMENKLLDLGYLVTHGFDLAKYITNYISDCPQNESYILSAFIELISYLRKQGEDDDYGMLILKTNDKITIDEAVSLFCAEIKSRYEQRITYSQNAYQPLLEQQLKTMPAWDYQLLAELKLSKEQYYNIFKLSTEEYLRRINTI
ncbi:MAG: hypothetical protein J5884_06025 [Paludibacteraceae bacterium]|nr:hypothetical protein [Paludibacteraceae bacterium]